MEKQNFKDKIKGSITIKIISILIMILLLMIPNFMVSDLIRERSSRKTEIEKEIGKSYGRHQKIMAPILRIPYLKEYKDSNNRLTSSTGIISISPQQTTIDGRIQTDTRKRSIYEIVIYNSQLDINTSFDLKQAQFNQILDWEDYSFDLSRAYFIVGISDPNGLSENSQIKMGDNVLPFTDNENINLQNMAWIKSDIVDITEKQDFSIQCKLDFKGTRSLMIEPIGEQVIVNLESQWIDPSFIGQQLPDNYDITEAGFKSKWVVNRFAHSYPKYWLNDAANFVNKNYSFGVKLIQPIDEYGKNKRTAKYALLIISLTFGIFFFFEILLKKNIHPIQYTLIGFALTLFYLLLLSITEHLGFDLAYIISSAATITLIISYTKFILESVKGTAILSALMIFLFGYIFVILQMQDFALVMGAIALFLVLATVMMLSRKVNWYQIGKS